MKPIKLSDLFKREATHLETFGRKGDKLLGHLTPGDVIVPVEFISPRVEKLLKQILGGKLARFTAGNKANSINPKTGLPEFDEGSAGELGLEGGNTGASGAASGSNNSGTATSSTNDTGTASRGTIEGGPGAVFDSEGNLSPNSTPQVSGYEATGIGFLDRMVNNPGATALNLAIGAIPGFGQAVGIGNNLASITTGNSIGSAIASALYDATHPDTGGSTPNSGVKGVDPPGTGVNANLGSSSSNSSSRGAADAVTIADAGATSAGASVDANVRILQQQLQQYAMRQAGSAGGNGATGVSGL